jgi:hypothetical protein
MDIVHKHSSLVHHVTSPESFQAYQDNKWIKILVIKPERKLLTRYAHVLRGNINILA